MASVLDSVRDYAQHHPISAATGLLIALPGTYLLVTGKSTSCTLSGLCSHSGSSTCTSAAPTGSGVSMFDAHHTTNVGLSLPTSTWGDRPDSDASIVLHAVKSTTENARNLVCCAAERLGLDISRLMDILEAHWDDNLPYSRIAFVAVTSSIPDIFVLLVRNRPDSWTARHQVQVVNALRVVALATVANRTLWIQDLLMAALVMVSFEVYRRATSGAAAKDDGVSAVETLLSSTHSVVAKSDIATTSDQMNRRESVTSERGIMVTISQDVKDEEIQRLHRALVEVKTADKTKDLDLKRTQDDLRNARETLNDTFTEYSSLRDEMKTMKQAIGRDHQAVIYRKDIELFALRKANEQKENYIKEKDARFETVQRQHKASIELKDSQIRSLKKRIESLQRREARQSKSESTSPVDSDPHAQSDFARAIEPAECRTDDEKDREIARLTEALAVFKDGSETLSRVQNELRRAWESTHDIQRALNKERSHHAQTREKLEEAIVRLDEETRRSQKNSPARLPTIEESDKQELEAMFNTAQQDNLRLYTEHEALDKRLREANARLFSSEQELETLKELLKFEKSINEDIENARPSVVHRVHFQRMEGQLKESRDALDAKDEEIARLQNSAELREQHVEQLQKEKDALDRTQIQLQSQLDNLKRSVRELESTKEQLMHDHERLAQHRARQRISSAGDRTSVRSSGATLITEPSYHVQRPSSPDVPIPARPVTISADSSIQNTPERMRRTPSPSPLRIDTTVANNPIHMISNDVPPSEIRSAGHSRRKSLTLKGLMRKMARKDTTTPSSPTKTPKKSSQPEKEKEKIDTPQQQPPTQPRPKTALMPKDKNTLLSSSSRRPKTATSSSAARVKKLDISAPIPMQDSTPKDKEGNKTILRPKTAGGVELRPAVDKENHGPLNSHGDTVRLVDTTPASNTTATPGKPVRYYSNDGSVAEKAGDKGEEENEKVRPKTAVDSDGPAGSVGSKRRAWSVNWKRDRVGGGEGDGNVSRKLVRKSLA